MASSRMRPGVAVIGVTPRPGGLQERVGEMVPGEGRRRFLVGVHGSVLSVPAIATCCFGRSTGSGEPAGLPAAGEALSVLERLIWVAWIPCCSKSVGSCWLPIA